MFVIANRKVVRRSSCGVYKRDAILEVCSSMEGTEKKSILDTIINFKGDVRQRGRFKHRIKSMRLKENRFISFGILQIFRSIGRTPRRVGWVDSKDRIDQHQGICLVLSRWNGGWTF